MVGMELSESPTYSRGQVEIALWETLSQSSDHTEVDRTFCGRIRKLLDLDRKQAAGANIENFAFHSAAPGGKGLGAQFGFLDAFCIAVALDLLDLGFKQSEVVYLLRHIRDGLEIQAGTILVDPPILRAPTDAGDKRLFMLIRKVELQELFHTRATNPEPVILRPDFCKAADIGDALAVLGYNDRSRVIIELAELAVLLEQQLDAAPPIQRGRST